MPTKRTYTFSADHVHPDWQFNHAPITIGEDDYGDGPVYYASHRKLGCGKSFPSPDEAIRHLLRDHACFNIVVHGEQGPTAEEQAYHTKPSVFVITCRSEDGQHYAQHCSDKYGCLSWCQLLAHADRFLSRADAKRFCTQINAKSSDWHTKASIIEVTNEKIEAAEKRAEELGRLAQEEEEEFNRLFPA